MRGGEEVVLEGLFANNCPRSGRRGSPENLRVAIVELAIPIGETEVHVTANFDVAAFAESHSADQLMTRTRIPSRKATAVPCLL